MIRGFVTGVVWGGVVAAVGLAVVSQVADPPTGPGALAADAQREVAPDLAPDLAAVKLPPMEEPEAVAPNPEAPVIELPVIEAPVIEAPVIEAPVIEVPVIAPVTPDLTAPEAVSPKPQPAPLADPRPTPAPPVAEPQTAPAAPPEAPAAPPAPEIVTAAPDLPPAQSATPAPTGIVPPAAPATDAPPQADAALPPPEVDEALLQPGAPPPLDPAPASIAPEPVTPSPAEPEPAPAQPSPAQSSPAEPTPAAPLPVAPALPRVIADDGPTTLAPDAGLPAPPDGVATGRLPRIGADAAAPADTTAPEDLPARERHARPFENPTGKPLFAVILTDTGTDPIDRAALAQISFPVSFVIDPASPDAAARAAIYREAGQEVLMLASGIPEGATASDLEQTFQSHAATLPETVAVIDLAEGGFQNNRPLAVQVVPIVAAQGRGLVTFDQGLNAADQEARRAALPSATIFRRLDADAEASAVIRRYLDRAAFKAGQEGRVVVIGDARPETVTALLEWAVEGRAASVALAPLTALLAP